MGEPSLAARKRASCALWLCGRCHAGPECRCVQMVALPRPTPKSRKPQ